MKKKMDIIAVVVLIMLGTVHTLLTPVFYQVLDLNALWFAGTGLAFLFLGFINIFRIRTAELLIKRLCLLGNVIAFIYCIVIVVKLAAPQAYISLIDIIVLTVLSLIDWRQSDHK